jgi:hypothetical protein
VTQREKAGEKGSFPCGRGGGIPCEGKGAGLSRRQAFWPTNANNVEKRPSASRNAAAVRTRPRASVSNCRGSLRSCSRSKSAGATASSAWGRGTSRGSWSRAPRRCSSFPAETLGARRAATTSPSPSWLRFARPGHDSRATKSAAARRGTLRAIASCTTSELRATRRRRATFAARTLAVGLESGYRRGSAGRVDYSP